MSKSTKSAGWFEIRTTIEVGLLCTMNALRRYFDEVDMHQRVPSVDDWSRLPLNYDLFLIKSGRFYMLGHDPQSTRDGTYELRFAIGGQKGQPPVCFNVTGALKDIGGHMLPYGEPEVWVEDMTAPADVEPVSYPLGSYMQVQHALQLMDLLVRVANLFNWDARQEQKDFTVVGYYRDRNEVGTEHVRAVDRLDALHVHFLGGNDADDELSKSRSSKDYEVVALFEGKHTDLLPCSLAGDGTMSYDKFVTGVLAALRKQQQPKEQPDVKQ